MIVLDNFIDIEFGKIENLDKELKIDTIVNAASPTLMGGWNNSVDKALHDKIDEINGKKNYLKKEIQKKYSKTKEKNEHEIRCNRGEVVKTKGYGLCKNILHTVGPKYDGGKKKYTTCSKSRSNILKSCYRKITEMAFYDPDIQNVAIPVIASGNYGFDFELAFKIGISEVYNTLLEIKRNNPELFRYTTLKKFYFIIDTREKYETAEGILKKYRVTFVKEKRVVSNGSFESLKELYNEIYLYDSEKGYFTITKCVRILLVLARMFVFPLNYLKDWIGQENWERRRGVVEIGSIAKVAIAFAGFLLLQHVIEDELVKLIIGFVMGYNLADTLSYLLSLIVLADVQNPSANVIRSMILLIFNYIEASIEIAVIAMVWLKREVNTAQILLFSLIGQMDGGMTIIIGDEWFLYFNCAIKFFFLTLVFGYFVNHLREREFRVK